MTIRPDLAAGIDALEGAAAVPRSNGEFVFSQPWEARAFAIAVAMCEAQRYSWDEFRHHLIEEVQGGGEDDGTGYYRRWLASLERLVGDAGIVSQTELEERVRKIEQADAHDEHHDHEGHVH